MIATTDNMAKHTIDTAVEQIVQLAQSRLHGSDRNGDGDVSALRGEAIEQFQADGFPTTKWEDWRYTNVKAIKATPFALSAQAGEVDAAQLEAFKVPGLECYTLVFVDGHYMPSLSKIGELQEGVRIEPLSKVLGDQVVTEHLGKQVNLKGHPFAALNTAFIGEGGSEGVFVEVADAVILDRPIQLLNVATTSADDQPVMAHPRNLIVAGADSEVKVIEHYVTTSDGVYLNNAVTEIVAGDNAFVAHYLIEEDSLVAYNFSELHAHLGEKTNLDSHAILLGGAIVRNVVHPVLAGENSHCLVNGLYVGEGDQHLDNFMRIEHRAPDCESHQYYNGILNDRSHGVFTGRIVVDQIAQRTDAKQTSANLLLNDDAQIDTMPQLEIYADDVKCTHGATIGQINEDAMFYLRARGISKDAARAMMVYAFAAETFDRMKLVEPIREMLTRKLLDRLPEGDFLETVLS